MRVRVRVGGEDIQAPPPTSLYAIVVMGVGGGGVI